MKRELYQIPQNGEEGDILGMFNNVKLSICDFSPGLCYGKRWFGMGFASAYYSFLTYLE